MSGNSSTGEVRGWSGCPECNGTATMFEGGVVACDDSECAYEFTMPRGPSYDMVIYDEALTLSDWQVAALPPALQDARLCFDNRPLPILKETGEDKGPCATCPGPNGCGYPVCHEHDNSSADREGE